MFNYPKSLQEFLNREDLPEGYKEMFEKLAQTEAGKEIIEGSKNLKIVGFSDEIKGFKNGPRGVDGSAEPNADGEQVLRLGDGFNKNGSASAEMFAFTMMHELAHVRQIDRGGITQPPGKEKSVSAVNEAGADKRALDAYNQAFEGENTAAGKEIKNGLLRKGYSEKSIENSDYEEMKIGYAKSSDNGVKGIQKNPKLLELVGGNKEKYDEIMAWQDDAHEQLKSPEMLSYEAKVGEKNHNLSKSRVKEKKPEKIINPLARNRLVSKKNDSVKNRRNRLNHFKQTGSVYNPNTSKDLSFDMEAYKKMQDNKSRSE